MTLDELAIGASATVVSVNCDDEPLRQHILDMGLTPGTTVTFVKEAPMGDPLEVRLRGYELTLLRADAARIDVTPASAPQEAAPATAPAPHPEYAHPGHGETGIHHDSSNENPLPEGTTLTFALVGNQNSGKTTLFNQLTGSNQHVGNFPGVTVDRMDGAILGHSNARAVDLPGVYSMSPYANQEALTRDYLLDEHPHCVINVVDATNIERGLYLTMQLLELDTPVVVALNMMDEVSANGGSVLVNELELQLGVPVVPISASKGQGIDELMEHAVHVAHYQELPSRQDFCGARDNGGAVHRCLHGIMHLIEDHAQRYGVPPRFAASKLAEGDRSIADRLHLDQNERETVDHLARQMEAERGLDRAAAIADMRFSFAGRVSAQTVVRPSESREHARSAAIDRILTGKYTAIPVFVAIMALVFWLTFNVIGAWLQDLMETGVTALGQLVESLMQTAGVNQVVQSLVIDGIFGGVGSLVSFLPIIVVLFLFLSLLEDSGYMARVAFVMDKILRKLGLSGRSIVPMLIGFGCSVPAVMASRTLPSERDRRMTIMLTPFMSCSAKMPVYAFLTAAFFPEHGAIIMIGLYFLGIVVGVLAALVAKRCFLKGEAVPFVMEMPNYRLPNARSVARLLWDKSKDFLRNAFTVVLLATIVIWFLQTFDLRLSVVDDSSTSILATLAGLIAPVFAPLGLANWRIVTALISGFLAKESIVATIAVLFGMGAQLASAMTPAACMALLVFCLLYTPCVATIASVRRELGRGWAAGMVVGQCVIAWVVALLVRLVCLAVGMG